MDEKSLIRIVAHLMGDGYINNRYLRYNNHSRFLIKRFKNDLENCFGNLHFVEGKVNSGTPFVQFQKKRIICFLNELSKSYKSGDIEIPNFVNTLEKKIIFIKTLFDDEGSVGLRTFQKTGEIKRDVHIALKSRKMIKSLKMFLENMLEIKTNRIKKDVKIRNNKIYTTWILTITGKENIENFREKIGFSHPLKRLKLDRLLGSYIVK
jgi:hypothetical protein